MRTACQGQRHKSRAGLCDPGGMYLVPPHALCGAHAAKSIGKEKRPPACPQPLDVFRARRARAVCTGKTLGMEAVALGTRPSLRPKPLPAPAPGREDLRARPVGPATRKLDPETDGAERRGASTNVVGLRPVLCKSACNSSAGADCLFPRHAHPCRFPRPTAVAKERQHGGRRGGGAWAAHKSSTWRTPRSCARSATCATTLVVPLGLLLSLGGTGNASPGKTMARSARISTTERSAAYPKGQRQRMRQGGRPQQSKWNGNKWGQRPRNIGRNK